MPTLRTAVTVPLQTAVTVPLQTAVTVPLQTTVTVPFAVSWHWDLYLKKCKIAERYFLLIYSECTGDITGTGYRFVFTKQNISSWFTENKATNQ